MNTRVEAVEQLQARLGYVFKDRALLERALTHSSVGDGNAKPGRDNERLEFLGDRVLGLLAAERLIEREKTATEGELAPAFNALVNRQACASVARRIGLGPALRLSGQETKAGGREKDSILADACEAVIAALYLDAGLDETRRIFLHVWSQAFDQVTVGRAKDPKTRLQEWALGQGRPVPAYAIIERTGPDHAPLFTVEVAVEGYAPARGQGASRQLAEKTAAQTLLDEPQMIPQGVI